MNCCCDNSILVLFFFLNRLYSFVVLKIVGYILAFYLILLAAVPCCAFDNCPDEKQEQKANHNTGDEDCGSCSPFFSCEGCATATISVELFQIEITPLPTISSYTNYIQQQLPKVEFEFWQPPKLG